MRHRDGAAACVRPRRRPARRGRAPDRLDPCLHRHVLGDRRALQQVRGDPGGNPVVGRQAVDRSDLLLYRPRILDLPAHLPLRGVLGPPACSVVLVEGRLADQLEPVRAPRQDPVDVQRHPFHPLLRRPVGRRAAVAHHARRRHPDIVREPGQSLLDRLDILARRGPCTPSHLEGFNLQSVVT